jgi:O-methyltransferase involved in polyketide biosynthesis
MSSDSPPAFAHRLQARPSLTAEAVTMARALEHLKPPAERVIDDPWAAWFLSAPSRRTLAAWSGNLTGRVLRQLGASGTTYVPLRHRFIDDHLTAALDGGATQVVLLGAGYDTRAYRFAERLEGRPVFEVDLAVISRAFFVWEGVPMYLTRAAVKGTVDAVHELSGDGSQIAHDMWYLVDDPGPLGTARRSAPSALSLIGEPVIFGVHPEDYDCLLARHGFRIIDVALAPELQARYAPDVPAMVDDSMYVLCAERIPL